MKVCWNITSRCNKNCKYCFKFNQKELTLEENKQILNKLSEKNITRIGWSGGEPFLYDGFIELLKLSKEKGFINHVHTNATLLTKENLKESIENIDRLIISLDFIKEDENKKYEIGDNYYQHISSLLEIIKEVKPDLEIQINTVLFRGSVSKIDELYDELKKYDIDRWKLIRFFPVRGKALDKELAITDEEFQKIMDKYSKIDNSKFEIIIHGHKEMSERHIIILSSGKLIYSENCEDKESDEKLI